VSDGGQTRIGVSACLIGEPVRFERQLGSDERAELAEIIVSQSSPKELMLRNHV
jgi:uncharacterized protein YbbK (DUF523 family)